MCAVTKAGSSKCTHGSREPNNVNVLASVRQELIEKLAAASFRMLVGVLTGQMIPVAPEQCSILRMEQDTAKISQSEKEVGRLFKINFLDISLGLQTKMPFRIKAWEFLVQDKGNVSLGLGLCCGMMDAGVFQSVVELIIPSFHLCPWNHIRK